MTLRIGDICKVIRNSHNAYKISGLKGKLYEPGDLTKIVGFGPGWVQCQSLIPGETITQSFGYADLYSLREEFEAHLQEIINE